MFHVEHHINLRSKNIPKVSEKYIAASLRPFPSAKLFSDTSICSLSKHDFINMQEFKFKRNSITTWGFSYIHLIIIIIKSLLIDHETQLHKRDIF